MAINKEKENFPENKLFHCYVGYPKSHIDFSGTKPGFLCWKSGDYVTSIKFLIWMSMILVVISTISHGLTGLLVKCFVVELCSQLFRLPFTLHSHISEDSFTAVRSSRFTGNCFSGFFSYSASKLIVLRGHSSSSFYSSLTLQPFTFGVGCLMTDYRSVLSKAFLHLFTPIFQHSSTSYTVI